MKRSQIYEYLGYPFGLVICLFYSWSHNYLISIFFLTLLVRLCLLPASIKQQKGQALQQRLQPKLRRIREKYGDDQRKIQEETQALYQREGFSAMGGGCLPMLIQFPIMIGVFQVNYHPLSWILRIPADIITTLSNALTTLSQTEGSGVELKNAIYIEDYIIQHWDAIKATGIAVSPEHMSAIDTFAAKFKFLGMSLGDVPNFKHFDMLWIIPIVSGIIAMGTAVYSLMRQRKTNPEMSKNPSMGCMMFSMPVMQIVFAFMFPISVGLYIIMSSLLSFAQMIILNHIYSPKKVLAKTMIDETIYRRSKEANTRKLNQFKKD